MSKLAASVWSCRWRETQASLEGTAGKRGSPARSGLLPPLADLASSCRNGAIDQNANKQPAGKTELYEWQLKKATEQLQRMDRLLAVQEQHAKRFGAILERWGRQAGLKTP